MLILAIETATARTGVALAEGDEILASLDVSHTQRHAETLAPAIQFLCAHTGVSLDAVGCVAVDIGPGLFTGLRVGLATAKAIAYACQVPVAPIVSLDALAFEARWAGRRIVTVLNALQNELFYAVYAGSPSTITRLVEPELLDVAGAVARIVEMDEECLLVGDVVPEILAALPAAARVQPGGPVVKYPSAASVTHLAVQRAASGALVRHTEVAPMYLREAYIHQKRRHPSQ